MSLASLSMYDLPAIRWANDALWAALAARLPGAPPALTRDLPLHAVWTDPDLLLAQTCGLPLVAALAGKVHVIATPCYDAEGCQGPINRSAIVVRRDDPAAALEDLRGRRAVYNNADSNSGMSVFRREIAPLAGGRPFFAEAIETGAHAISAARVASGASDVACIDPVTLALLTAAEPETIGALRILAWARPTPGLPLITSQRTSPTVLSALRAALDEAAADPALAEARAALRLTGFVPPPDYAVCLQYERDAVALGYPELA